MNTHDMQVFAGNLNAKLAAGELVWLAGAKVVRYFPGYGCVLFSR